MARFDRSRDRRSRRDSARGDLDRDFSGRGSRGGFRSRDSRGPKSYGRKRVEKTKVTCSSCGEECEVPFKPTSSKPVYCDACFAKKGNSGMSERDLDIINEKLNKIMKALKIE